jgi:undecaprenyl pyrophosphate synthase
MANTKGKKPTNKDRDKALRLHEQALRDLIPKFNQLHNQVQDFFAVFSMFVEFMGKDDEFGEFVKSKIEKAKQEQEENDEVTIPADNVVAEDD